MKDAEKIAANNGNDFSINELMKKQEDFVNEITLLQFHAEQMGVKLDRTPKCHPELAGEGIEYAWAFAKLFYRRSSIDAKRSKAKFLELVKESTNPNTVLNKQMMRSASKKARSYMKLYSAIESECHSGELKGNKHSILESTIKRYLKMKKMNKSHRGVIGNKSDIRDIQNECSNNNGMTVDVDDKTRLMNKLINKMNSTV